jgi:hypothetical protein
MKIVMKKFKHFLNNPITADDGYHIGARDAVNIDKYLQETMRDLKGGLFRRAFPPMTISDLADDMYQAWEGRMPKEHTQRICQPDILSHFGIRIADGYIKEE